MTTLRDIALLAGVSGATVSNVLRDRGSVSAETSARVREAAQRLGYRPNPFARALARGRAPTIAVVFSNPNLANPFYAQFAFEAEQAARRHDHFLLVCHAAKPEGGLDTAFLESIAGRLSGGVVILGSDTGHGDLLSAIPRGVPTVLSMWEDAGAYPSLPCVTVDFFEAGRLAADHLAALGHRRIGVVVGGAGPRIDQGARLEGALATLRASGLSADAVAVEQDSIGGGHRAAGRLLAADPTLTAILATNDLLGIGAMHAAADRGLSVPDQLSVIGITDIWLAAETRPTLTTVDIDTRHIAETSVNLLLDLIANPAGPPLTVPRVVGRPRLVRRASTAQAP